MGIQETDKPNPTCSRHVVSQHSAEQRRVTACPSFWASCRPNQAAGSRRRCGRCLRGSGQVPGQGRPDRGLCLVQVILGRNACISMNIPNSSVSGLTENISFRKRLILYTRQRLTPLCTGLSGRCRGPKKRATVPHTDGRVGTGPAGCGNLS